ncbi:hypothetical protein RINTHM_15850 [Richelia intracellularis HM01]|uniref:hypothetical protein n=1 Tax=Richelia intracellularis TaxID=1164990 RepID=UPI0002B5777B|nr:hypothetical protein [Richelia intracellularis]CCH66042.1 hypothetical protein RINTHM_15850 [Richelia intracellularis HM01]
MTDLLVRLYTLLPLGIEINKQLIQGITIRHAIIPEKHFAANWVRDNFNLFWMSECDVAFHNLPVMNVLLKTFLVLWVY